MTGRTIAFTLVLACIWVLLWGSASIANILSGLAVAFGIVLVVPGLRRRHRAGEPPVPIRPLAVLRLIGHFLATTVRSNVVLTREIVTPRSGIHTGVVGVELPDCSDGVLTLINNLVALAPGTMPLELTSDPTILYVHVLHLYDVERVERQILRLTELTVRAFGSASAIAAQDRFPQAGSTR